MIYTEKDVDKAREFAKESHKGQTRRKTGEPYFTHCEKVASFFEIPFHKIIAYLHDVMEDCGVTFKTLTMEFDVEIALAVKQLTHGKDQTYMDYIKQIPFQLRHIKIADILSNTSDHPTSRMLGKYHEALTYFAKE